MKYIKILIFLILSGVNCLAGNNLSQSNQYKGQFENGVNLLIDERLELVSIVFRLAGAEEYMTSLLPEYMEDVDTYFKPYIHHELLSFIRETRKSYKFGFSTVAASAFMIKISDKSVKRLSNWDIDKEFVAEANLYWTREVFDKYVELLDNFYKDSRFYDFWDSHKEFYKSAIERNTELIHRINMQWFEDFFGKSVKGVDINMGLCMGNSNYFIWNLCNNKDWSGRIAIVMGANSDIDGVPLIKEYQYPTIIHEISHYYTRPLVEKNYALMEKSMEYVYSKIINQMNNIGYGDARSMTGEWLNELFVNLYLKNEYEVGKAPFHYKYNIVLNEDEGYIWMGRAVLFMDNFYYDRIHYPTIKEFMPQLVAYANSLKDKWDVMIKEHDLAKPYVVDVFPAGEILSSGTKELRIRFSRKMIAGIQGLMKIEEYDMLPFNFEKCRWEDEKVFVISLNNLEQGNTYGVLLPRGAFFSEDYHSIDDHRIVLKIEGE